jgi:uncharacterized membrane protein
MTGLSTLALALSAYLSWHYLMGGSVIGCTGGSSCDQVLSSQWSSIAGILPVSGLAAGAYLAILIACFFIGPSTAAPDRRLAWNAMLLLVGAAAGSAVWFTILQKSVIGAFCPYCMAAHTTGLLLAVLVIWHAARQFPASSSDATLTGAILASPVLLGLTLAAFLAAAQVGLAPPAVYLSGESQEIDLPVLNPHAAPVVGSPDAPYVVTLLFDYKCPHCQRMHLLLDEVIRRYQGKLAFVLAPAPLNSQCNPYIARNAEEFKDSCELARIGLAVWVAKPDAFRPFDDWMFSAEPDHLWHPRAVDAARAKAAELVGQAKFDAALADPAIDRFLQISTRIYGNTILPDQGGTAVPKLVFGTRWVTPEPYDADDLVLILHHSLALPIP